MEARVRIDFEMSGGYGGLFAAQPLRLQLDTEELPAAVRDELATLVDDSGLLQAENTRTFERGPQRDALQYRVTISDGQAKSFALDDATAPVAARPLLERLKSMAIEKRMRGR
jgi:hypothetical protein